MSILIAQDPTGHIARTMKLRSRIKRREVPLLPKHLDSFWSRAVRLDESEIHWWRWDLRLADITLSVMAKRRLTQESIQSWSGITVQSSRFLNSNELEPRKKNSMTQSVIEKALRVRILTGFSAIILLTLLIAAWSYFHISQLGDATEHLYISNYRSIQYAHAMEQAVARESSTEPLSSSVADQEQIFRDNLKLEYQNITEPGELELARSIEVAYAEFHRANDQTLRLGLSDGVTAQVEKLLKLNERAMFAHSESVKKDATFAKLSTLGITTLLVSIAIFLAVAVSRRSLTEFRELDRAKSNFVATAAHELKNPLSSIKTTTGILLDGLGGPLSQSQSDLLSNVHAESERLLTLVRELLDLARLETGTLKLEPRPIEVYALIENATVPVLMQASRSGVTIDIHVANGTPEIEVDPNKIGWAITNLALNAIRYSPLDGQVMITASSIDNEVWIAVSDKGVGLSAKDAERIFEKFVQVDDSAMGSGVGSGLGLSIAREVVVAHNGRIWADSTPGKGATFTIALPINRRSRST
jgi:signal transduction histidine kinase